jgi:hypothetical protein
MRALYSIFLFLLTAASLSAASDRPNVLLILTDNQSFWELSYHGHKQLQTPHIDTFMRSIYTCSLSSLPWLSAQSDPTKMESMDQLTWEQVAPGVWKNQIGEKEWGAMDVASPPKLEGDQGFFYNANLAQRHESSA